MQPSCALVIGSCCFYILCYFSLCHLLKWLITHKNWFRPGLCPGPHWVSWHCFHRPSWWAGGQLPPSPPVSKKLIPTSALRVSSFNSLGLAALCILTVDYLPPPLNVQERRLIDTCMYCLPTHHVVRTWSKCGHCHCIITSDWHMHVLPAHPPCCTDGREVSVDTVTVLLRLIDTCMYCLPTHHVVRTDVKCGHCHCIITSDWHMHVLPAHPPCCTDGREVWTLSDSSSHCIVQQQASPLGGGTQTGSTTFVLLHKFVH